MRIEFLSLATGRIPIHGARGLPPGPPSGGTRQTAEGGLLQEGCVLALRGPGMLRGFSRWRRAALRPLFRPRMASGLGTPLTVPLSEARTGPAQLAQPGPGRWPWTRRVSSFLKGIESEQDERREMHRTCTTLEKSSMFIYPVSVPAPPWPGSRAP